MKIRALMLGILVFGATEAHAWDFAYCGVVEVVLGADDRNAHVQLNCNVNPVPSCPSPIAANFVAFDRSTPSGKQKLALVMYAQAVGGKVTGFVEQGVNSCPEWQNNVALLRHIRVAK